MVSNSVEPPVHLSVPFAAIVGTAKGQQNPLFIVSVGHQKPPQRKMKNKALFWSGILGTANWRPRIKLDCQKDCQCRNERRLPWAQVNHDIQADNTTQTTSTSFALQIAGGHGESHTT